jgi:hypothetical protein
MTADFVDCDNCSHCVDLKKPTDTDAQSLKDTRALIKTTIEGWLNPTPPSVQSGVSPFLQ